MSKVKGGDKEKQRLWNPETLKLLKKNGSDLSKPHDIVSVFHIFDIRDIFPISEILEQRGYLLSEAIEHSEPGERRYWSLDAILRVIPEINSLNEITDSGVDIAKKFDADYDGWYTQAVD